MDSSVGASIGVPPRPLTPFPRIPDIKGVGNGGRLGAPCYILALGSANIYGGSDKLFALGQVT